ncbi:hypothetical protein PLICRDRAFT_44079 [Plicaturopsis crispa FD-325 SS-3]|nr:hypothetical protein PLICRDRAFT_44079 [Plicaturopsis crispa FD-325 SS-3]
MNRFIFALVVVSIISCISSVIAHSAPPRPLKRVANPSTLALEILPRKLSPHSDKRSTHPPLSPTLLHSDSFRLTLSAFGSNFHLHLRPNDHLIHPSARITYYNTDPLTGENVLTHTEPLLRESVKAYLGEVVPAHLTGDRLREDAVGFRRPGADVGWARIVVHHQGDVDAGIAPVFEGAFAVHGVVHHVMTKDNYFRSKHPLDPEVVHPIDEDMGSPLVIWRDSDVMAAHEQVDAVARPQSCGHDHLPYNTDPLQNQALQKPFEAPWYDPLGISTFGGLAGNDSLVKRQDIAGGGGSSNFAGSIGQTAGCPTSQRVVYMGVAADCKYTAQYGSQENATQKILTNWNTASSLYKSTFNISLGIVELQVQNSTCPTKADPSIPWNVDCTTGNVTLNDRLSLFSGWRGARGNDGVGLWHLMSGCPTGSEVGIAWLATLCQQTTSGTAPSIVSGTAVSTGGRTEWQVVAHEIGHNFGAIHDCADGCNSTSACCPRNTSSCSASAEFIMSPVAEAGEMKFSPCSIGNICSLMTGNSGGHTNTSCVVDPNDTTQQTISLQMCGNGIVEPGEDCDPGRGSNSTCCNAATCKFTSGSVCDPDSSACCTQSCSFAPSSQVCRPAKDSRCDTAEMCTGSSSSCPTDVTSPNGQSCGGNGLACASGTCTSLDQQCQSAGGAMNLQQACPNQNDKTCQVSCVDPSHPNQCVSLQSQLIDGSPCGFGGMCMKGNCQPGSLFDTAKSWYIQNLQIAIPVSIVAGIIALVIIISIIIAFKRCCCGKRPKGALVEGPVVKKQANRISSWGPGPPPPDMMPPPVAIPPPLSLQPGTSQSYNNAPSRIGSRKASVGSRDRRVGNQGNQPRPPQPPMHTRPSNGSIDSNYSDHSYSGSSSRSLLPSRPAAPPQSNWVDASLYNGPPRR